MIDYTRHTCEWCRHYDETAYAFDNHHASGRLCKHRDPYQPDLSPFRNHPSFPFITHAGSCCRAFADLTFDQNELRAHDAGRLF